MHYGLDRDTQRDVLHKLLVNADPSLHAYMCGPGPFIELVDTLARESGWAESRLHREYFKAPSPAIIAGGAFELHLARSGITLQVGPDQTIVEAMRASGIDVETACEQGMCGTCLTTVLDGEPDHRDRYFSEEERGNQMLVCVSRARSARLAIDR
jgi:vanillate O-demethylase ferredoxin subunit